MSALELKRLAESDPDLTDARRSYLLEFADDIASYNRRNDNPYLPVGRARDPRRLRRHLPLLRERIAHPNLD